MDRRPSHPVVVTGAGLMGAQIAVEYAVGGHHVHVHCRDEAAAGTRLDAALAVARQVHPTLDADAVRSRVVRTRDPGALPDAHVVIESLPEDLELKSSVLHSITAAMTDPIIASNTSSLSVTELGRRIDRAARTVGVHYWNPPLLMPLVEVTSGADTDPETAERMRTILLELEKVPVDVCKDIPGFVWNRLQFATLREALHLVREGVATVEDIDTVTRLGLGRRWNEVGLFASIALGGATTWSTVAATLFAQLSDDVSAPGDLAELVSGFDNDWLTRAKHRRDANLARAARADRATPSTPEEQQ